MKAVLNAMFRLKAFNWQELKAYAAAECKQAVEAKDGGLPVQASKQRQQQTQRPTKKAPKARTPRVAQMTTPRATQMTTTPPPLATEKRAPPAVAAQTPAVAPRVVGAVFGPRVVVAEAVVDVDDGETGGASGGADTAPPCGAQAMPNLVKPFRSIWKNCKSNMDGMRNTGGQFFYVNEFNALCATEERNGCLTLHSKLSDAEHEKYSNSLSNLFD